MSTKRPTLQCTVSQPDILLLLLSALFGCIIAVGQRTEWQVPIESAQVLAGLVTYPATDNPFYIYHMKSWTLLNQGAALLLKAGIPECTVSLMIEGLIGAVSFSGISLIVQAVCRNSPVALLLPLLMYSLSLVGSYVAFPIALLGTDSSYGILGLSYVVLVFGLLGSGHYLTGAFLAGLAPALHPAVGIFCVLTTSLTILINLNYFRPHLSKMLSWFFLGGLLTLASFGWQFHHSSFLPRLDPSLKTRYVEAFIKNFDYHRTVGGWTQSGVLLGFMLAVFAGSALRLKNIPTSARIVFSSIITSFAVTLTVVLTADFIPSLAFLKVLIPWRFMNYANLCILPLSFGFLAADYPQTPRVRSLLFTAALISCFAMRLLHLSGENILFFCLILSLLFVVTNRFPDLPENPLRYLQRWQGTLVLAAITLFVFRQVVPGAIALATGKVSLKDRTNTEIFRTASIRPGILLTAGNMHLFQLVTRRPVLIDGAALDMFPYVADTGPRFNEILKKVYGLDIFVTPPAEAHYQGMLTFYHQSLWEKRSCAEWREIREEFGVTDVVTPLSWKLQLPVVIQEKELSGVLTPNKWVKVPISLQQEPGMALYTIPEVSAQSCGT